MIISWNRNKKHKKTISSNKSYSTTNNSSLGNNNIDDISFLSGTSFIDIVNPCQDKMNTSLSTLSISLSLQEDNFISSIKEDDTFLINHIDYLIQNIDKYLNETNYYILIKALSLKLCEKSKLINVIMRKCEEIITTSYGKEILLYIISMKSIREINQVLYYVLKHYIDLIENNSLVEIIISLYNTRFDFVTKELNRLLIDNISRLSSMRCLVDIIMVAVDVSDNDDRIKIVKKIKESIK